MNYYQSAPAMRVSYRPSSYGNTRKRDVVAYDDDGNVIAVWPWFLSSRPTKRSKHTFLNCARRRLVWVDTEAAQ